MLEDTKTINEEYKEYVAWDIIRAIKQARQGKMELGLDDIAIILKEGFTEEELAELKKYL